MRFLARANEPQKAMPGPGWTKKINSAWRTSHWPTRMAD
jgi:hypothetical protein